MAQTPEQMEASMARTLEEKTGKPLQEWVALARGLGAARHGEIVSRLKAEHGLGHGYANLVAAHVLRPAEGAPAGDELVEAAFSGPRAALRPWYDALLAEVHAFGPDVELAPKKGYVSLRRSKQFGLVQPSTATRLDVGMVLKGVEPTGRLEPSGSWNAMVTHRVRVTDAAQVDAELVGWLRRAYDAA
jgi:predicted transport protein